MTAEPDTTAGPDDSGRRDEILRAATECFAQLGRRRTSMQDVARVAGVSRGTVYRYFPDRDALAAAAVEYTAHRFYRDAAVAMADEETLAEQVGALAETQAATLLAHRAHNRVMADDTDFLHQHAIVSPASAISRTAAFLEPYVADARRRGEVGVAVDVSSAAHWLARMLWSLTAETEDGRVDVGEPAAVRGFVATFTVNGLR